MAGNKYLEIPAGSGDPTEKAAIQTSAGAADAGKIIALNSSGLVDNTMLPETVSITVTASEDIAAGAFINLWNSAGTIKVRNADCSSGLRADGFVLSAIANGASGTVLLGDSVNSSVSGLTIGSRYYLSTIGGVTSTPPTTAGYYLQYLGVARSATEIDTRIGPVIVRA